MCPNLCRALSANSVPCQIRSTNFDGWNAQELSNPWVRVTLVPQLGGRVMQVNFAGHDYLFVNPKFKGHYFPPDQAMKVAHWINYGGDKIWPLPEGDGEGQWPGPRSDVLDDGQYKFTVLSDRATCRVRLEGPADSFTGLRYSREISIGSDSPEVDFHSMMTNASDHPIRWSVQSVSQYDTADATDRTKYNHDFYAFAPVDSQSAYLNGYHVRNGLADDPSFSVNNGIFTLHWLYLENEVWLDSDSGWIAVIDNASRFGMIERFHYAAGAEYPGRASVIFYKNGAAIQLDQDGMPQLRSADPAQSPYYMEAELNSPMIQLQPGKSSSFDTSWYPVRTGKDFISVTNAGIVEAPLAATVDGSSVQLSGTFAVFFPGHFSLHIRDTAGNEHQLDLGAVDPVREFHLDQKISLSSKDKHVALHLIDLAGKDVGTLAETDVGIARKTS